MDRRPLVIINGARKELPAGDKIPADAIPTEAVITELRNGTDAERLAIIPALGEPVFTTDTHDLYVGDGVTPGGISVGGIRRSASAYIVVNTTDDPEANGDALLDAYEKAKELLPNGGALSATNRAVVILPPARYDLGTNGSLVLDTEFVDIVGLTTDRASQVIVSEQTGTSSGTIRQTANDVSIENITALISGSATGSGSTRPAAYFPDSDLAATKITNCGFFVASGAQYSMRIAITYSGTYRLCACTSRGIGGGDGSASGTFSGKAYDCDGGDASFGGGLAGVFSGEAHRCRGAGLSFAGGTSGSFSGQAYQCLAGGYSFGGNGSFTGLAIGCRTTSDAVVFAGPSTRVGGRIVACIAGGNPISWPEGVRASSPASNGNSGLGEDSLVSYLMPRGLLSAPATRVVLSGVVVFAAAGANGARLRIKAAGTTVVDTGAVNFTDGFLSLRIEAVRDSATQLAVHVTGVSSNPSILPHIANYQLLTVADVTSNNMGFQLTGEVTDNGGGTGNNQISLKCWLVEMLGAFV